MTAVPQLVGKRRILQKTAFSQDWAAFSVFPACFSFSETAGVVIQNLTDLRP
jgi:hypothetical protein